MPGIIRQFLLYFLGGFFAFFSSYYAIAQQDNRAMDNDFGLNPKLYNGVLYSDFYGQNAEGNQFIDNEEFHNSQITLLNQRYEPVLLNYDVFSQKVILQFADLNKAIRQIEIPQNNITSFGWNSNHFEIATLPGLPPRIYQIIGTGNQQFYIYWSKKLVANTLQNSKDYSFSLPYREIFYKNGRNISLVSGNRSLLKLVDPAHQNEVKKWLRTEKIKVQKANDAQLLRLTQFLQQL